MSAFLGPIHFWLYNKIGKQEELTKAIASMAAGNGWISDRTAYIRDLPALEDVIDESNIHGWLQDQIHDAETRYADLIQTVLTTHPERLEEISKVAFRYGRRNGRDAEKATDVFRIFEDFFVNGMPCDRVNTEVSIRRSDIMNEAIKAGEVFRLAEIVPYQDGKIVNMDVVHNDKMKFVIMAFDAGTELSEHAAPGEALIFVLDGEGVIGYEGKEHPIKAGENFRFAKAGIHSVKAAKRFKMALLLTLES